MNTLALLLEKIDQKKDRMIEIRRHLHQYPELSFQEENTAKFIENFYKNVPIDKIENNVGGQRGIVVTIKGRHSQTIDKTIALRADFDALPLQEETGLSFSSKNPGVMHACGHDAHTAYMLILAESLAEIKDQLTGEVRIIHQPAEETPPGGALAMVKAGVLEGVDSVFGIHLVADHQCGSIKYCPGNTTSARSFFKITIQGKGGHGASPHLSNDSIVAGSSFIMNLQTIVSRRVDPFDMAVVTVGSFDGKGSPNIIKDSVVLKGDVRTMKAETQEIIEKQFYQMVAGLESTFGVEVQMEYVRDYPAIYNNPELTMQVKDILQNSIPYIPELTEVAESSPWTPSEDFSYFAKEKPGCFLFVGAMPEDGISYPHHHPKFLLNEKSMIVAAKAMATIVTEYCG